jgi:hypothetical protein
MASGEGSGRWAALLSAAAALAAMVGVVACGGSESTPRAPGTSVAGPGILTTAPPWPAQYRDIKRRLGPLALPKVGDEKFHTHQLLHIYDNGILVPVAADIGVDARQGVETALHTHDQSGVVHMEAERPFTATLGDLFTVWGVALGPDHVGGLKATDESPFRVFVNGRRVTDPAAHRLAKDDNIVIAAGSIEGVPLVPDTTALRAANGKGGTPVPCSVNEGGKKPKSCFAPKQ